MCNYWYLLSFSYVLTYALEENIVMLFRTGAAVRMGWIQEASVRYTEVKHMTIKDMKTGQTATILKVGGEAALRQHFLDMGLIQGAEVTVIKYAPMGDPVELRIHGYELTCWCSTDRGKYCTR